MKNIANISFISIPKQEVRNFVVTIHEQNKNQPHKTALQTTVSL
jgi:hypothetical protein